MIKQLRISKTNSDSVRITIPKYITEELNLSVGSYVDVYMKGKKIIIDTDVSKEKINK